MVTLKKALKNITIYTIILFAAVGILASVMIVGTYTESIDPHLFMNVARRYSIEYEHSSQRKNLIEPSYLKPLYENITENSTSYLNKTKDIYVFTEKSIRYVDDYDLRYHNQHEYYQEPINTLSTGMADCDGFQFLITSFLRVENNLTFPASRPRHSFTITCVNGSWYRVDPLMNYLGKLQNSTSKKMSINCRESICPTKNMTKLMGMC